MQATFLSYGLNGAPLSAEDSGNQVPGPSDGAGLAPLSPAVKDALTGILAEDIVDLRLAFAAQGFSGDVASVWKGKADAQCLLSTEQYFQDCTVLGFTDICVLYMACTLPVNSAPP